MALTLGLVINSTSRAQLFCTLILLLSFQAMSKETVYLAPEVFLKETFRGKVPKARIFWLTKSLRPGIRDILGHDMNKLRLRYWYQGQRSAWILEEIGKEKPITTGIVIENHRVEQVKILIFRESRGWEVHYAFFTDQFTGSRLIRDNQLDRHIDGITGATLSVRAVTKLARLALYLHYQVALLHEQPE